MCALKGGHTVRMAEMRGRRDAGMTTIGMDR
jgi:hypothetical protein